MYINSKTWINGFWSNERGKRRGTAPRRALDGLHVRGYDNHILSNRDTHTTQTDTHTDTHIQTEKREWWQSKCPGSWPREQLRRHAAWLRLHLS